MLTRDSAAQAHLCQRHETTVHEQDRAVVESQRRHRVDPGAAVLRHVHEQQVFSDQVLAGRGERIPLEVRWVGVERQEFVGRARGLHGAGTHRVVECDALLMASQLPEPEVYHDDDQNDGEHMEPDHLE